MGPRLIHHLLEEAADSRGSHTAIVDRDRTCTYAELDARANQVAHALRELGVMPGDRVGLYLDKSIEAVAGIYGALKAGAAYVPLDAGAPTPRLGYIARDCGLRWLVTGSRNAKRWAALIADGAPIEHMVVVDPPTASGCKPAPPGVEVMRSDELARFPSERLSVAADGRLAYILYTSGSTGSPKGVMLSHENGLAYVDWAVQAVGVTADDRLSSHAPFHFDLSIFDLFAAAAMAATLVLVPSKVSKFPVELARFIGSAGVTVWYSVPSALTMLVDRGRLQPGDVPQLRVVIFAGEVFPTGHLARLMELLPHADFWNFYGPTETNVCTAYKVPEPPDPDGPDIPIGSPIAGVHAYVVADDGTEAPPDGEGELLIGGPTVMQGYWADQPKTERQLVPDPVDGKRLVYRTGDLVARRADGNFQFLGRRDNQIKSRGYRIELGEIETALHNHPGVVQCAVIAVPDVSITNRLHAFVVLRDPGAGRDLARFCAERLPSYMVPEHFELLSALPQTSTGKVDRQALRASIDATD